MTGFSKQVREIIHQREDELCARCGWWRGTEIHHRRTRGMGGTRRPESNQVSNGALLCAACHLWITEHPLSGRGEGWVVPQNSDPADIPVLYRGQRVLLDDLGIKKEMME